MNTFNSQSEAMDLNKVTTAEDLLALLRKGSNQKLEIGFGELKIPCRLINAKEEATILSKAAMKASKENPMGDNKEVFEAQEVMKSLLMAATTIDGAPSVPMRFFEALTNTELNELYDQYITINKTINPNFQDLTKEEIGAIVDAVKKNGPQHANALFTWQAAAVGRFFLKNLPI